ncbi:hypothetical protein BYT27DRAFT_7200413 [Phlegmacium glaucopus]|nr:hypothetical protein BYT27DRAFT_7200413 [Phlegmacium glaucopus]
MANVNPPHVLLNEEYANPVIHRMPSLASSAGTVYVLDETTYSDTEYKLSDCAFAQKCEEQMELHMPREEEREADQDPLLTMLQSGGIVRVSDCKLDPLSEKLLHDHVMGNLRKAVAQLNEHELFERTLRRGSQAALEIQPSTNDIDTLMRSMMSPSMNITSGRPHIGMSEVPPLRGQRGPTSSGPGITNGPWNNFGKPVAVGRRDDIVASGDNMISESTVGKRSRNGNARKT